MKMTLTEWLAQNGYASAEEAVAEYSELDDLYPALCVPRVARWSRTGTAHTAHPLSSSPSDWSDPRFLDWSREISQLARRRLAIRTGC